MIAIIHYHEIALKGKNRPFFEKTLCRNIFTMLKDARVNAKLQRISGRIILRTSDVRNDNRMSVATLLSGVFGIKNFSFGIEAKAEMENIKNQALRFFQKPYPKSFKIQAQRSEKNYPFTSKDLENEIGAFIKNTTCIPVDLEKAEKTLFIEIVENRAFLYCEKVLGIGGLPFATAGKIISLLSAGLDSPVASWYLMKRGCEPVFLHFHGFPFTPLASQESVKEVVKTLKRYSPKKLRIIFFPFGEIQKYIVLRIPAKFRIIFYRRIMMKIGSDICRFEGAWGIATGDSLGQVASQTLENIRTVSETAKFPIFRPLIGFDKEEIIEQAKKIGTYEISASAGPDCCSLFMPRSPATKTDLKKIKTLEKKLTGLKSLIKKAMKEKEIGDY